MHAAFLILLFPLAGFGVLTFAGRRLGDPMAGWLGTAMVAASFVATLVVFADLASQPVAHRTFIQDYFSWMVVGGFRVNMGVQVDQLSMTMALFVTGVSTVIHLYSIGYMKGDDQYPKFFVYMNLFVLSMLVLVLADNFLFNFLGWEGVGLCSYLLISFWFGRESAATAGKKAFIVNRVGDFGFLIAMFLMFDHFGTLDYRSVFAAVPHVSSGTATAIGLLLFMGAVGKSAQIPLFTWLPDAMEGPTPVSALIHAATMVTAGVYLMSRASPILQAGPATLTVIAVIGVATAFVAATIAVAQNDIKRVLAYSTVSQLGYMFLAVGSRAYLAAIFLMIGHAFYKALLFLSAGSVIHGNRDNQDLKLMGGLRRLMPITFVTFLIGWLAIGGIPPLVGFWAKGDVLIGAYTNDPAFWAVGSITAALTAYYIGREFFLAFYGPERWHVVFNRAGTEAGGGPGGGPGGGHGAGGHGAGGHGAGGHGDEPHDPPPVMWVPLVVLAAACILGGLINLPFHPRWPFLDTWLTPVFGSDLVSYRYTSPGLWGFAMSDAFFAVLGTVVAARLWVRRWDQPALEPAFLQRGWEIDYLYDRLIARPSTVLAGLAATVIDNRVIDGAVNGLGTAVRVSGSQIRRLQTGYIRNYALGIGLGLVLVLAWVLSRAGS
jgi:NADH-quinone oxidoreductase subunit L